MQTPGGKGKGVQGKQRKDQANLATACLKPSSGCVRGWGRSFSSTADSAVTRKVRRGVGQAKSKESKGNRDDVGGKGSREATSRVDMGMREPSLVFGLGKNSEYTGTVRSGKWRHLLVTDKEQGGELKR